MKKYITKQSSIKGAGKGLFTKAPFKKGEVIGLAHVDDQPASEIGRNHNHNEKNPTAYSKKIDNKRFIYASKNLKPGEEITTNYRMQPELEQPEDFMRKGGSVLKMPNKKNSKGYSRSLSATNKLFTQNFLFAKPKSRKNKVFDPNSKYYAEGGALLTKKVTCKKCGWKWDAEDGGKDITTCHECGGQGLVHAQDGGESKCPEGYIIYNGQCVEWQEPEVIETDENTGYNAATGEISQDTRPGSIENNGWWTEHEKYHHLQNLGGGASTAGFLGQRPNNTVASDQAISNYYDRRNTELEAQTDAMIKADPNLQFIPRNKLQEFTEGFPGANALMYQDPTTEEGEARVREEQFEKDGKSMFPKKQDGGNKDAMTGMMKARLAYANEFGNPAAERMINLPDNPYQFDNGDTGSHYMASMDNYAVPQIQDENGVLQLGDYGPESNEAIRFDSNEDANYFAENYKDVSPGFIEADLDEDEIEEYRRGGYVVEEIDNYQDGGIYTVKGSKGNYKKVNGKWQVDWNRSGKYQPLNKGDVKARTAVLDKMAKPVDDSMSKVSSNSSDNTRVNNIYQKPLDWSFDPKYKNNIQAFVKKSSEEKEKAIQKEKEDSKIKKGLANNEGIKETVGQFNKRQDDWEHSNILNRLFTDAPESNYKPQPKGRSPFEDSPMTGIGGAPKMVLQAGKWLKPLWTATKTSVKAPLPLGKKITDATGGKLNLGNSVAAYFGADALYNQGDSKSDVVKSQSNFINNPSWNTLGDASFETGVNALGFLGLGLGKQVFKPAYNASKNLIKGFKGVPKQLSGSPKIDLSKYDFSSKNLKEISGFLPRRQFIKNLQKEELIGKDFQDLNYAARSTDRTNKLTKLALNREATKFRGVDGSVPRDGKGVMDYTNRPYDMSKPSWNNKISEFENMKNAGVNFDDPISIAKYQATHVPMQQYGYRSGMPDMSYADALYTSDVPSGYGKYMFKLHSPRDYSTGNYQDWFNKYHNLKSRKLNKLAVNNGYWNSQFMPNNSYDLPILLDRNTVVGKKGQKMFDVDETYPFMDYKNLDRNKQIEYKNYLEKLKKDYNTGFRGQYKQGGENNDYVELDLTPEEVQRYKEGGYIVEEIDNYQNGGFNKKGKSYDYTRDPTYTERFKRFFGMEDIDDIAYEKVDDKNIKKYKQTTEPIKKTIRKIPTIETKSNFELDLKNKLQNIAKENILKEKNISKVEPIKNSLQITKNNNSNIKNKIVKPEDSFFESTYKEIKSFDNWLDNQKKLFNNGLDRKLQTWGIVETKDKKVIESPEPINVKDYYKNPTLSQTILNVNDQPNRQFKQQTVPTSNLVLGSRNRGQYQDIESDGLEFTTFHPFSKAANIKPYNKKTNVNGINDDNSVFALDNKGVLHTGIYKNLKNNKDWKFSKTFMNKIVSIDDISLDGARSGNPKFWQPQITILENNKLKKGALNILTKKGKAEEDYYGSILGGRVVFVNPTTKEQTLVSGSVSHIKKEFKRLKGNSKYLEAWSLDNGTYARGLSYKDGKLTKQRLVNYDAENTSGGNGLYIKKYNVPVNKFKETYVYDMPNVRTKKDDSYKAGHKLKNEIKNFVLHHTAYNDPITNNAEVKKQFMTPGQNSSHVVIEEDGSRTIYASPEQVSFHAGKSKWNGREDVNDFSIGVEFQGDTQKKPLTDQQVISFVEYYAPIAKKYNLNLKSIITHEQIRNAYIKKHANEKGLETKPDITYNQYKRILNYMKAKGIN